MTAPQGWARRNRPVLLIGVAVTAVLVLLTVLTVGDEQRTGALDPENPDPDGARAVARVLAAQGVEVEIVRRADELADARVGPDATVLVTSVEQLGRGSTQQLGQDAANAATLVLAAPGPLVLRALDLPVELAGALSGRIEAACANSLLDGLVIDVPGSPGYRPMRPAEAAAPTSCFADVREPDLGALVVRGTGQGAAETYVLGAAGVLSNEIVTEGDNAAAALRLLGQRPRLVWYVANARDIRPGDVGSFRAQLPPWLLPGLVLVGFAAASAVLWRGRRLGRLAVEPLPVRVPAIESTQGRGRLYRAVRDREHAAAALRQATGNRLAEWLRLPHQLDLGSVAAAVAHATGRRTEDVSALLGPGPVPDDSALTHLAAQLADIEREVRRP